MNKMIDALSEEMRIVYETAENNMVAEINSQIARDGISNIARRRVLENKLGRIKLETDSIVDKMLSRVSVKEGVSLTSLQDENRIKTSEMALNAVQTYGRSMSRVIRLRSGDELKKSIIEETQRNIADGLKVTYRNGRTVGYKEYMEMATRTTIQREIGSSQLSSGGEAGIIFYIVNHFRDCADDHADYQGKIYYDERWRSFGYSEEDTARIERIIRDKKMLGVQSVRDGKPWLTTRPNCRHTFTPITIEQAGGKASDIVRDMKLSTGSYRDANYADTEKQRYNERQIRFYKNRMEQNEKLNGILGGDALADKINADKMAVRRWQARQRQLIEANPSLARDYRRETAKTVIFDLGASKRGVANG